MLENRAIESNFRGIKFLHVTYFKSMDASRNRIQVEDPEPRGQQLNL